MKVLRNILNVDWSSNSCVDTVSKFIAKLPYPRSKEKKLTNDLRNKIRRLPPLRFSESEADNVWNSYRNKLRSYILQKDPRYFLQWDVIRGTMSVEDSPFVKKELEFLKKSTLWDRYKEALIEGPIGSPKVYKKYPQSSGNLIHQAYHMSQFEIKTSITIDKLDCIFEFGGGYGCMCKLSYNLGFKGRYIIFDSEEFSALQEYYLRLSGVEVADLDENPRFIKGVICISDPLRLKSLLTEGDRNLFLATWSISETSVDFRDKFFGRLPEFENYLIAYRSKFKEVDNVSYFSHFARKRNDLHWHNWEIPHLKDNFYLISSKSKV